MHTERPNGAPAVPVNHPRPEPKAVAAVETKLACNAGAPEMEYVLASTLLPQSPDTRDRSDPSYLEWEQQIAADIDQRGVQNPLHVLRLPDRRLQVLAGETRRRARLLAGDDLVPVIIHDKPMNDGEIALEQLLDDELRYPLSDSERAEKYLRLMQLNSWTQGKLAASIGRSAGAVSKLLAPFMALPDDLRACIGRGPGKIPITAAAAIARLGSEEAIRAVVQQVLEGGFTRDEILALVGQRLGQKPKGEKPLKLKGGGIDMTIRNPTPEAIQCFLNRVSDALKKLAKDGLPLNLLPDLLR